MVFLFLKVYNSLARLFVILFLPENFGGTTWAESIPWWQPYDGVPGEALSPYILNQGISKWHF